VSVAAALAQQAMKIAPAIGQGVPEALRTLLDLTCMMVQLDSQLGHRRASHGAEHVFAEMVKADPSISHPEKVAAGILYAAALNGLDVAPLRSALESAAVRLDLLTAANIRAAANGLADYTQQNGLPYGTASDQTDSAAIAAALTKSTLMAAPASSKAS
jgi:glycerol dehydrogenase-like iron-containing ADH family enzyme